MTIVFVVDVYDSNNPNGTTMTAVRFAEALRERGHVVRIVANGSPEPDKYIVPEWEIPIAKSFAHKQGFVFAKPVDATLRQAIQGADIVHLLLPLKLEIDALKIAQEYQIPCSAAFHLQPENITYNIHMQRAKGLSKAIYVGMRKIFYNQFKHIHCPSEFIANQLRENGYTAKLHVISNGVTDDFQPLDHPSESPDGLFRILMTGRLSPEKRQDVLIDGVRKSKYADKIQLYFAGKGPREQALIAQGQTLAHPPIFNYYTKKELIDRIHSCQLYVHASDIEIEAIACIEAFACGLVPVIANSERSATPQFALDDRSLFPAGNSDVLAERIDYWIEHPDERNVMSQKYARLANRYRVNECVRQCEQMFEEAIADAKKL